MQFRIRRGELRRVVVGDLMVWNMVKPLPTYYLPAGSYVMVLDDDFFTDDGNYVDVLTIYGAFSTLARLLDEHTVRR